MKAQSDFSSLLIWRVLQRKFCASKTSPTGKLTASPTLPFSSRNTCWSPNPKGRHPFHAQESTPSHEARERKCNFRPLPVQNRSCRRTVTESYLLEITAQNGQRCRSGLLVDMTQSTRNLLTDNAPSYASKLNTKHKVSRQASSLMTLLPVIQIGL